jgi:hypothetical protein
MAADEPESADSLFANNAGDDFFGTVLATPGPEEQTPESSQPALEDVFSSISNKPNLFASQEQSQYEQPVQPPLSVSSNGAASFQLVSYLRSQLNDFKTLKPSAMNILKSMHPCLSMKSINMLCLVIINLKTKAPGTHPFLRTCMVPSRPWNTTPI